MICVCLLYALVTTRFRDNGLTYLAGDKVESRDGILAYGAVTGTIWDPDNAWDIDGPDLDEAADDGAVERLPAEG